MGFSEVLGYDFKVSGNPTGEALLELSLFEQNLFCSALYPHRDPSCIDEASAFFR